MNRFVQEQEPKRRSQFDLQKLREVYSSVCITLFPYHLGDSSDIEQAYWELTRRMELRKKRRTC